MVYVYNRGPGFIDVCFWFQKSLAEFKANASALEQSNGFGGFRLCDVSKIVCEPEPTVDSPDSEVAVSEKELADARDAFVYEDVVEVKEPRTV